jgi:hypothetical protein
MMEWLIATLKSDYLLKKCIYIWLTEVKLVEKYRLIVRKIYKYQNYKYQSLIFGWSKSENKIIYHMMKVNTIEMQKTIYYYLRYQWHSSLCTIIFNTMDSRILMDHIFVAFHVKFYNSSVVSHNSYKEWIGMWCDVY